MSNKDIHEMKYKTSLPYRNRGKSLIKATVILTP